MKKALLIAAFMSLVMGMSWAGDGKFGEINLKFGYDFQGDIVGYGAFEMFSTDFSQREFQPMTPGISAGAEYLFPVPFGDSGAVLYPGFLKLGAGVQYLFTRSSFAVGGDDPGPGNEKVGEYEDFSFLPIYAIVQLNPAKVLPGLYFRGMVGYSVLLQQSKAEDMDGDKKGGLHWGLAAGYETAWGFFFEYAYAETRCAAGMPETPMGGGMTMPAFDIDLAYYRSSFSVGYKIKL
jgi:hypothetical protein